MTNSDGFDYGYVWRSESDFLIQILKDSIGRGHMATFNGMNDIIQIYNCHSPCAVDEGTHSWRMEPARPWFPLYSAPC
jgi:hypothetical protein